MVLCASLLSISAFVQTSIARTLINPGFSAIFAISHSKWAQACRNVLTNLILSIQNYSMTISATSDVKRYAKTQQQPLPDELSPASEVYRTISAYILSYCFSTKISSLIFAYITSQLFTCEQVDNLLCSCNENSSICFQNLLTTLSLNSIDKCLQQVSSGNIVVFIIIFQ